MVAGPVGFRLERERLEREQGDRDLEEWRAVQQGRQPAEGTGGRDSFRHASPKGAAMLNRRMLEDGDLDDLGGDKMSVVQAGGALSVPSEDNEPQSGADGAAERETVVQPAAEGVLDAKTAAEPVAEKPGDGEKATEPEAGEAADVGKPAEPATEKPPEAEAEKIAESEPGKAADAGPAGEKAAEPPKKHAGTMTYFAGLRSRGEPLQLIVALSDGQVGMKVKLVSQEMWAELKPTYKTMPFITRPNGNWLVLWDRLRMWRRLMAGRDGGSDEAAWRDVRTNSR